MKKSTLIMSLLLILVLTLAFPEMSPVKADSVIYIRADGAVDGTSTIQINDDIYSFTDNITGSIIVERDNIVLDGAGFVLSGYENDTGIYLMNRNNVTIRNVYVENFKDGIFLINSSNNKIIGNKAANCADLGIWLNASSYNIIKGNEVTGNYRWGILCTYVCNENSIVENYLSDNGVHAVTEINGGIGFSPSFDTNASANYITNNKYGIWLQGCINTTISGNNVTYNEKGIEFAYVYNCTLSSNIVTNNGYGIYLDDSQPSNNILRNNQMKNNTYNFGVSWLTSDVDASNTVNDKPICCWFNQNSRTVPSDAGYVALISCSNITVKNLSLSNNVQGILLSGTTLSTITGNNITKNSDGIHLSGSKNNDITGNNIAKNGNGVYLSGSSDNNIYHNNFLDNTQQAFDYYTGLTDEWRQRLNAIPSVNIWDNDAVGNYWSNYNGPDDNNDGIGDTPNIIDDHNQDRYPIIEPLDITNIILPTPAPTPTPTPTPNETPTHTPSPTTTPSPIPEPTPETPSEPFTTILAVIAAGTLATLTIAGLLVYFKKRKH